MGFRANKAYLQDERTRFEDRLKKISDYIKTNPSISLEKRVVNGKEYFYERFKKDGKAIARYFSKSPEEAKKRQQELKEEATLRKNLKEEKKELKRNIALLERQLKIVDQGIVVND